MDQERLSNYKEYPIDFHVKIDRFDSEAKVRSQRLAMK